MESNTQMQIMPTAETRNSREDVRRRNNIKKNIQLDEARKSREEVTIQIRKEKKDSRIKARRNMDTPSNTSTTNAVATIEVLSRCMATFQQWDPNNPSQLDSIFQTVREVRRFLCDNNNPPVDLILKSGFLMYFLRALQSDDPRLQFESAWALTNLTSSDSNITKQVAECDGVVHELARLLLAGTTADVRLQCAWCIGNIAGDSSLYRDGLLAMDLAMNGLVHNIIEPETDNLLGIFVWALRNVFKESSHCHVSKTLRFVRPLIRKLDASLIKSEQLRMDICYCLQLLAEGEAGDGTRAQVLLDFDALTVLMKVLSEEVLSKTPSPRVLVPLIRCIGMFAVGTSQQTEAVLSAGFLDWVASLLKIKNQGVVKEVLWVLSNIAAGTPEQAARLSARPRILKDVVDASQSENWMTRREGLWTICNLLTCKVTNHTKALHSAGAILPFCHSLEISEFDLLCNILDGLDILLIYDATLPNGNYPLIVEEEGALDKIELLLQHRNDGVYQRALKLIENHWGTEPDMLLDEDENLCPKTNKDSSFAFGLSHSAKQLFPDENSNTTKFHFECAGPGSTSYR